jgi:hypothetical protein
MRLTVARLIAVGLLYVVAYVAVSIVWFWRHPQGEAHGPQGDYLKMISISTWWWVLVGPPLLLAALWAWQRSGGGRAP